MNVPGHLRLTFMCLKPSTFFSLPLQITTLLELVFSCCGQVPHALALYYDELANLIQKGNLDLQILVGYRVLGLYPFPYYIA